MTIPIKPNDSMWTSDQWNAIYAGGKDILVAAAAGSGKTAVLVERIIQKILDDQNPVNVDELFVATFTNAAAAEMRQRIGIALEKEIAAQPHSHHLRRQLSLLNQATISTLHSFCLDLVRNYYYLIDIDPGFRILDETEGLLLRDEAIESLLEEEYGRENNEPFFRLVDIFTNDRSDQNLQELILKLYNFARANPAPDAWLDNMVAMYEIADHDTVEKLPFIHALLFDVVLQLQEAKRLFENAMELTKLPGGPYKRAENFLNDLALVDGLLLASNDSFQTLYNSFQNVKFTTLKSCKGEEFDEELVEKSKKQRDKGKEIIQNLKDELFSRKPETYLKDLQEMKAPVATLAQLVRGFSSKFYELKKEKALVDFSDLEHFALQILGEKDEVTGEIRPTTTALSFQKQFKEVFIDEYQDVNMVQETILQLVKKPTEENGNLFMVGDVKQAIYRFRLAEPNLFLHKYTQFTKDGERSGLRIDLSKNFRSRKEVLDGTNFIFKQIMGSTVGEINYDDDAELKRGADYPLDQSYPVELAIVYKEEVESEAKFSGEQDVEDGNDREASNPFSEEELEQSELESRYVAKKIRELVDSKQQVYDTKRKMYRPIQYRDIVILFRSFTWAPQFMEQLKEYDIPAYAEVSSGYFDAAEVATMMSLLQVIDNPYQDIPLTAVLRSPIIGLNEEELARIRIEAKRVSFYEAVKQFMKTQPKTNLEGQIQQKLEQFITQLNQWRTVARSGALSDLIWQLYRDTKFYDYTGGLPGGKQRQANLRALYDRARQYESTSFRGLFRFLRFIERMRDRGEDLGVARSLGEKEDVVRIMTIHSSKGLEFPVVFIAGMARKFNMMDLNKSYLFDKDFGFATNYVNPEKQITYPSIFHMALKRKKKLELVAEEMRVLYVALTRAKEKLYLVGSCKDKDKLLEKWQKHVEQKKWLLSDYDRMKCTNYLDWVAPAIIRHKDGEPLRVQLIQEGMGDETGQSIWNHPSQWDIKWIEQHEMTPSLEENSEQENLLTHVKRGEPVPVETQFKERIVQQLNWQYRYLPATVHRSKQSVSEVKRLKEIRDDQSGNDVIRSFKKPITTRPKFMQEKTLTPAEKGTAMHLVMQHIDLTTKPTNKSVEKQLYFMQQKELLTAEEVNAINIDEIVQFFTSELGIRMLTADWVNREIPFSFSVSPYDVYSDWQGGEDPIFIQGIIDCLFRDGNGLVLVDYKTDQITNRFKNGFIEAKPILLNRYKTQVDLYRKAIESIIKEPVTSVFLFFFDGGHLLEVK